MPRTPRLYQLTPEIVASSVGAGVLCLAPAGMGRSFRLYAERPDARFNRRVVAGSAWHDPGHPTDRATSPRGRWSVLPRADLPSGAAHVIEPVTSRPGLIRVDIAGPIEQRAGYHDPCGGWSDGHDTIAERLCAAFAEGDVLLVVDSPGGAAAGLQQAVAKALAAKVQHGRRVTVWANEQIGSAATWWASSLGDEIFIPPAGQIGSIGARGGHLSIAGAMAQAGEVMTYFTWPGPGKVALAPELPLSELGAARGNRDVAICGEAFCAAVVGSAIGQRHGLDRDRVVALGADMLTGQAAVDAGLCDGIASEEEVTAYALRMAESGAIKDAGAQARARGGTMTIKDQGAGVHVRAGDDEPPDSAPGEDAGLEPTGKCASCAHANDVNAKFCDQCGASLAAPPVNAAGDEPPPSSKPMGGAAVARVNAGASFAEILRLPADASVPAQKSAAIDLREVYDYAAQITGQTNAARIVGGLKAIAHDAAQSGRLRAERNAVRQREETRDRWDLCRRLVACGGAPRGKVFVDKVDKATGQRVLVEGKPVIALGKMYAEMRLDTLRGEVEGYEKNAPPRDPFQPDRERAEETARNASPAGDTKARVERAKQLPAVRQIFDRPGQTLSLDAIASSYVAQNFDLNGAQ